MLLGRTGPTGVENWGMMSPGPGCTLIDWMVAVVWHSLKMEKVRLALVQSTPASFSPTSPKFMMGGATTRQVGSLVSGGCTTLFGALGSEVEKAASPEKAWAWAVGWNSRETVRLETTP